VQADVHDRPVLPVGGPTLDRTEWGKDPGLELGFDPVLDQIQYLAENGLTSLMVLHNFLSKRLAPLQDWSHRPAWIYTGVNDIMRLDRGPGSSLGDTLLVASLKALTTDQPSAELVTPPSDCKPLCVKQAARTALLAIMPTLDDVDIALVQRGHQSHGVVIPGPGGPGGAISGHGHGGVPIGGGSAGSRSGAPAGGRGGAAAGSSAAAPGKGKQPLQKRQLSGVGPAVLDEAVVDKRAAAKRATEEAAAKRAAEEAAAKKVAEERAAEEAAAAEAAGAAGGSPAPVCHRQRSGPRGLRLQVAPPRQPNVPTGVFENLGLSSSLSLFPFFCVASFSYYPFCPGPLPPARPPRWARLPQMRLSGPAPVSEPWTPEGVPEDVVESEGSQRWYRRRL
jgi:hypothetical protein